MNDSYVTSVYCSNILLLFTSIHHLPVSFFLTPISSFFCRSVAQGCIIPQQKKTLTQSTPLFKPLFLSDCQPYRSMLRSVSHLVSVHRYFFKLYRTHSSSSCVRLVRLIDNRVRHLPFKCLLT